MADLKEKIQSDLKTALKEKGEIKSSALRMLLSAVGNKEIELKKKKEGLSEEEFQNVIRSEAKKRKDSVEAFTKAERPELAEKEKTELLILQEYLPPELSEEEIEKTVKEVVANMPDEKDFGKIMGQTMAKLKGRADGKKVGEIVKKLLNN